MGTAFSDSLWGIVGFGIRLSQDMGLHRKKGRRTVGQLTQSTVEDELCTRAFRVLLNFGDFLPFSSFFKYLILPLFRRDIEHGFRSSESHHERRVGKLDAYI